MQENFTEVLILNNPIAYRDVDPSSFDALIKDGTWIPIVLNTLRAVVERHYFELCDLNWDYLRDENQAPENYQRYKTAFYTGLNGERAEFLHTVVDEIENELRRAANEAILAKGSETNEE